MEYPATAIIFMGSLLTLVFGVPRFPSSTLLSLFLFGFPGSNQAVGKRGTLIIKGPLGSLGAEPHRSCRRALVR